jgi:alpha-ribazole phosphatase
VTIFVRHAELAAFAGYASRAAMPMSEAVSDATQLLDNINCPIDIVYTSPLPRCLHLAQEVASRLSLECVVEGALQEMQFGDWEGQRFSELEQLPTFQQYMANWQTAAPPSGESLPQFEARIRRLSLRGENPLVLTHAGVIRAMHVIVKQMEWPQAMALRISHLFPYAF